MKAIRVFILIVCYGILLSACNLPLGPNSPGKGYPTEVIQTLEPIIFPTETRSVVIVEIPSATAPATTAEATLLPETSATAYVPFTINSFVDGLNVRTNPGYLFPIRGMVQSDTPLTVLGRSPGDEWFYIQTPDKINGWVFNKLFSEDERLLQAPLVEPGEVQIVRGLLLDAAGKPVNGVQFALTQGAGNNAPRNDANTDENGVFLAFMPLNTSGQWMVSYVAISCDSNVMDANCVSNGTVFPTSREINLPSEEVLTFTWR